MGRGGTSSGSWDVSASGKPSMRPSSGRFGTGPVPSKSGPTFGASGPMVPRRLGRRPRLAVARDPRAQLETAREGRRGGIVAYVYGLIGFVVAIALAIIVLQIL